MIFFNNFSIKKLYIKRVSWFSLYNFSFNYFTIFSFENLKIFYFIIISFSSKKFIYYKKGYLVSNLFFQNFFYNLCKLNIIFLDSKMNTVLFDLMYNRRFNKRFFRLKRGFFLFRYHSGLAVTGRIIGFKTNILFKREEVILKLKLNAFNNKKKKK